MADDDQGAGGAAHGGVAEDRAQQIAELGPGRLLGAGGGRLGDDEQGVAPRGGELRRQLLLVPGVVHVGAVAVHVDHDAGAPGAVGERRPGVHHAVLGLHAPVHAVRELLARDRVLVGVSGAGREQGQEDEEGAPQGHFGAASAVLTRRVIIRWEWWLLSG